MRLFLDNGIVFNFLNSFNFLNYINTPNFFNFPLSQLLKTQSSESDVASLSACHI